MPIADTVLIAAVAAQRAAIADTVAFVHAHPELAHEEHLCAAHLAGRLGDAGLRVEQGVAGLGKWLTAAAGVWDDCDAALYAHPEFIDTVSQASLWMRRDTFAVAGALAGAGRGFEPDPPPLPFATDFGCISHRVPAALIGVGRPEGWAFHTDEGAAQFASTAGLDVAVDMATVLALATVRLSEPLLRSGHMAMMFEHLVRVRWRDTDAQGHVNHAVFLTYLEEGRDAFYAQILGSDPSYVVVRLEVDLRAEVRHLDQQVTVRIQAERLGTTSLTTRETILTSSGEVAAEARVVTVRWDPGCRQPIPFNETERTRLAAAMAVQPPPGELPPPGHDARAAAVPPTTRSAHELLTRCNQRADRGQFALQLLYPGPVQRDMGELDVFVAANEIW